MDEASRWGLGTNTSIRGPDHAFYFAVRNSRNGPVSEGFGLIGTCGDTLCKITTDALSGSFAEVAHDEATAATAAARLQARLQAVQADEQHWAAVNAVAYFALGAVCMFAVVLGAVWPTSSSEPTSSLRTRSGAMLALKLPLVFDSEKSAR